MGLNKSIGSLWLMFFPLLAAAQPPVVNTLTALSPSCLERKDLEKYLAFNTPETRHFRDDLIARAACTLHKTPRPVLELNRVADMVEVRLPDGFTVWVQASSLMPAQ